MHKLLQKMRKARLNKKEITPIAKADNKKQIVYAVVLDPHRVDSQGDIVPPAEIEKAAHEWLIKSRVIGYMHKTMTDEKVVESWIVPYPEGEYEKAIEGKDHRVYRFKFGSDFVSSGTWILGVRLSDERWAQYISGEINAFSMGGYSAAKKINLKDLPKIEVIDLDGGKNE